MGNELIDLEKQCLKSWIYFVIELQAQPILKQFAFLSPLKFSSPWELDEKNNTVGIKWNEISENWSPLFFTSNKYLYELQENSIDKVLPTDAANIVPSTMEDNENTIKWNNMFKLNSNEKEINKLKELYESAKSILRTGKE